MSDLAAKLSEARALAALRLTPVCEDCPPDGLCGHCAGDHWLRSAVLAMADCIEQIDSNGERVIDDALRELRLALSPNPPK